MSNQATAQIDDPQEESTNSGFQADSLATGLSLLLILTVGQRFIGFGRNILFCRWLEPAELGRWNLAYNLLLLVAPLVVLGLPGSFGRYVEHYRQKGQLKPFLKWTTFLTIALTAIGLTVMACAPRYSAWLFFGDEGLSQLLIMSAVCLASVIAFNFLVELLTSLRQLKAVSYIHIANSILFAVFSLCLLIWWKPSAMSIVAGYGLACLVTGVASYFPLAKTWNSIDDDGEQLAHSKLWTKLLPFAWWIWFSDIVLSLFSAADRYMIVHFSRLTPDESAGLIGQYHSSLIIPMLMVAVAYMVGSVIMPYLTSDWELGKKDAVTRNINASLQLFSVGGFAVGVGVLLFSPLIFGWALQGKYTDGLAVLPWTLAFSIWAGLLTISMCHLRCAEKAGIATIGPMIGLCINVALNLALLPWLGLLGAVLATASANLITYGLGLFFCSRFGFRTERGTIVLAFLPLALTLGVPGAMVAFVISVWAILRTDWIVSRENKVFVAEAIANRIPERFVHWTTHPLLELGGPQTAKAAR